jgi:hypothetical protein
MALTFTRTGALPLRGEGRGLLAIGALMGLAIGIAVVVVFPDAHPHALNAAGAFKGTPIPGVQAFVEKIKGSLVWLGITCASLVVAVIAIMFMAGHSRAHDHAVKTLLGLGILASVSGIVA